MEVYLDNSATTKVSEIVKNEINDILNNYYGNPSSIHDIGMKSEKKIRKARKTIAKYLGCKNEEIIFTSGGTESNNLAIIGYAIRNRKKGNHIITSKIEHKSVINSFEYLKTQGFDVTFLNVNQKGMIDLNELENKINENTILISLMHVNNEIGNINKINEIGDLIKKNNSNAVFHVDGVQAFGKYKINLRNIDMYSFSGHKIHSVKGVGGLYKKKSILIDSIHKGGQQESEIRPGTENLIGISAMGKAVEEIIEEYENNYKKVLELKESFTKYLNDNIEDCVINGAGVEETSPYVLSIALKNIYAEVLLHSLESKKVYISTGSACNSKSKKYSHVIEALNIDEELMKGTIRVSFSKYSTMSEIEYALKALKDSIDELRKIIIRSK